MDFKIFFNNVQSNNIHFIDKHFDKDLIMCTFHLHRHK